MADQLLTVEVVTELGALSTGLDKATKDIQKFVNTSVPGIENLQKVLNSLGVNTAAQGIKTVNTALQQSKIDTENSRKALVEARTEQVKFRTEVLQGKTAITAAAGSYAEAQQKLSQLGREIKNAEGGFTALTPEVRASIAEYNRLNTQLQAFDSSMGNNQRRVGSYIVALDGFKSQLSSVAMSYLSLYGVMAGVKKVVSSNAEVSDSLADVQRTAQLTGREADALATNLKKIDTRTSLKGLVDIATIGGQMGIAKNELAGFTKAVDMLSVTLSGEIKGGAEEVASSLGKINGVFKVQQNEGTNVETSLNKTGSAILKLGQIGLATGGFLQDFALRTAGVAQVAKIALPVMLAYGATLEESGVSAEVAGTAVVRLISALSSKREQFYAIAKLGDAKLTLKEFTDLINTDAQKALTMFFGGLKAGNPTATEFSDRLDTIKIKAGPSKNAIIALAENQEKLNQRISEGTKAYNDGTLAVDQFAIKNDNLAANLSKLANTLINLVTNGRVGGFFNSMAKNLTNFTTEMTKLVNSSSWSEFWSRFTSGVDFGKNLDKDISIKDAFASVTKKNQDNTKYVTGGGSYLDEDKMLALGQTKYNAYLAKVKDTFVQSANAYNMYSQAVKKGEILRNASIERSYSEQYDKARYLYQNLLNLQTKLKFTPTAAKTSANDPTVTLDGTKKSVRGISDVLKELQIDLKQADNQFSGTFGDRRSDEVKAYQRAIDDLIKLGFDPASSAIKKLKAEQAGLFSGDLGVVGKPGDIASEKPKPLLVQPVLKLTGVKTGLLEFEKLAKEFNDKASGILSRGLSESLSGIGQSIGDALANGGSLIDALGGGMLKSLGSVLTQLGEMAIQVGIGIAAIKTALKSLNPVVAIAAGVALVALGSFVSSKSRSIGEGSGSTGSQANDGPKYGVPHFADGGIVSGPTLAMVGEYPAAKHDPEVISPLSKLKAMMGSNSNRGTSEPVFEISNQISMGELITAIKRKERSNSRG